VEIQVRSFLPSPLDEDEWLLSRLTHFVPWKDLVLVTGEMDVWDT
jgi:hypothetical protein